MKSWSVVALAGAVVALGGCGGDDSDDDAAGRAVEVYTLVVRRALIDQPPPDEPDVLPVVYVMGVGEAEIEARIQAEVADRLRDDAEVRFADERAEAILADDDGQPVHDEGVLLVVGEIPEAALSGDANATPFELDVEVYRSAADGSTRVLTIGGASPDWTVTSSTVVDA